MKFKKLTLREKYSLFLEHRGYTNVPTRNKYNVYKHPEKEAYLLVGNNGYLRANSKPVQASSYSAKVNDKLFNEFCLEKINENTNM